VEMVAGQTRRALLGEEVVMFSQTQFVLLLGAPIQILFSSVCAFVVTVRPPFAAFCTKMDLL
jgi:hypothetical protein